MRTLLLAALPALLWGQVAVPPAATPRRIEVQVEAPDMVFRFTPRVVIPGMPRVALALSGVDREQVLSQLPQLLAVRHLNAPAEPAA